MSDEQLTKAEICKLRHLLSLIDITEYVSGAHRDTVVFKFNKPLIVLSDENIAVISEKNIVIDGAMTYINMTEELPREAREKIFLSSKRVVELAEINPTVEDIKQNWAQKFFTRILKLPIITKGKKHGNQ